MDTSTWIVLWLLLLCLLLLVQRRRRNRAARYLKMRGRKEGLVMTEAVKKLIGRECVFYLLSGEVQGIVREVEGRSVVLESRKETQVVNLDFVMRVRAMKEKKG